MSHIIESHHGNGSRSRRDFGAGIEEVESQSDDDTEETMDDIPEEDITTVDDSTALVPGATCTVDEVMVENEVERSIAIKDVDVEMKTTTSTSTSSSSSKRNEVPLMEYILNVCKFLESMLSNNSTADHCKTFIKEGGLPELIKVITGSN